MSVENPSVLERLAIVTRYLLVALFAAALVAGLNGSARPAHAAAPVGAAPNYLSCTIKAGGNNKLYITDTNKKVICVYALINDGVRLVSVRKFDADSRIVDGSLKAPVPLDGIGVTREGAHAYVKLCRPLLDAAAKKIGHPLGGE